MDQDSSAGGKRDGEKNGEAVRESVCTYTPLPIVFSFSSNWHKYTRFALLFFLKGKVFYAAVGLMVWLRVIEMLNYSLR